MNDTKTLFDEIQGLGDEVLCWVELAGHSELCRDKVATWRVRTTRTEFVLVCGGCKDRFDSFGTITEAHRL